jgi:hypothetical protein
MAHKLLYDESSFREILVKFVLSLIKIRGTDQNKIIAAPFAVPLSRFAEEFWKSARVQYPFFFRLGE